MWLLPYQKRELAQLNSSTRGWQDQKQAINWNPQGSKRWLTPHSEPKTWCTVMNLPDTRLLCWGHGSSELTLLLSNKSAVQFVEQKSAMISPQIIRGKTTKNWRKSPRSRFVCFCLRLLLLLLLLDNGLILLRFYWYFCRFVFAIAWGVHLKFKYGLDTSWW